jgi:hypothetical protein
LRLLSLKKSSLNENGLNSNKGFSFQKLFELKLNGNMKLLLLLNFRIFPKSLKIKLLKTVLYLKLFWILIFKDFSVFSLFF